MPIADLLTAERIVILVEPGHRDAVLDAAARLLSDASPSQSAPLGDALRRREDIGTTAIGHGVAIPHARSEAWQEARGAFLRLDRPVDFRSGDATPVDLVFAMTVPEHSTEQHLLLLAELADRFADAGFRDALRAAPDIATLRALLHHGVAP